MIVFDLEWNSGLYTKVRLDEILQIGAVKVDMSTRQIVGQFNAYIRPQVHKRYSPAAAALPDLALSLDSRLDFPTALADFLAWCGEDRLFASWGNSDLTALIQNQQFWKLPQSLPQSYVDLQLAFGRAVGSTDNLSLEWAAGYCGAPDIFDPHNALVDAAYAAICGRLLTSAELQDAVRAPGPYPKGQKALPRRAKPWQGPFDKLEPLLNNRGCRKGLCPRCAAISRVSQWHRGEGRFYYSRFACPQCGRSYLLRLEVFQDKAGKLWGNTAVFRHTGQRREEFLAASQNPPIPCRGGSRRRYRRRKPRTNIQTAPI